MKPQQVTTFRRTALALALAIGAGFNAHAATATSQPQPQTCAIMEILSQGDRAMSYNLPCTAGDWQLSYTGTVPAGIGNTNTNYRLKVMHPQSGATFSLDRSLELPSVAVLGRALLREAVLLSDGDIGLRDCDKAGCSDYRPLGAAKRVLPQKPAKLNYSTKSAFGGVENVSGVVETKPSATKEDTQVGKTVQPEKKVVAGKSKAKASSNATTEEVQSMSPSTITKGNLDKAAVKGGDTHTVETGKQASGDKAQNGSKTKTKAANSEADVKLEKLQQDNANLKVQRTNLTNTVKEQAQQIEQLKAAAQTQAPVNAADKTNASARATTLELPVALNEDGKTVAEGESKTNISKTAVNTNVAGTTTEAVSANATAKSKEPKQGKGVVTDSKETAAKPLLPKTSANTKPVRAPKPSAAGPEQGNKPLILPTEYYRVTPDGPLKVYQIEGPAIIEVLPPK